jgi:hypothetical protein
MPRRHMGSGSWRTPMGIFKLTSASLGWNSLADYFEYEDEQSMS